MTDLVGRLGAAPTPGSGGADASVDAEAFHGADRPTERGRGPWWDVGRRLVHGRLGRGGLVGVLVLLGLAALADGLAPYPADGQQLVHANEAPSWAFPLGTDLVGRDVLSRTIHGARVSLAIALGCEAAIVLLAVPFGAVAGYRGGWVDGLLMRAVDLVTAIPSLLLAILVVGVLGHGTASLCLALVLTSWLTLARLTRVEILALRERDLVVAARALGAGPVWIVCRHMLPNAASALIVAVTFGIPQLLLTEAALSFIGIGVSSSQPSWGQMLGEHQQYLRSSWWLALVPAAALAVTMLSFTALGDGLRDALDPRAGVGPRRPPDLTRDASAKGAANGR